MRTPGMRRSMALILIVVSLAAYYLYDRFTSVKDRGALSALLYQVREQDIRLERDMERIISFRLPHYDSLIKASKNIHLLTEQIKQQQQILGGWYLTVFSTDLEDYLNALKRKRQIIERIQSHVALVRNSLLYLPSLLVSCSVSESSAQDSSLLYQLVVDVYAHYLFPDKVLDKDIYKIMETIQTGHERDANVEELLRHVKVTLQNVASIEAQKRKIAALNIQGKLQRLRQGFIDHRAYDDRNAILIGMMLLFIVFLLMTWLWRTLAGLDQARRVAQRAHDRLQDAVESLGEAFALFDKEHRLVLWNKTYADFYPWLKDCLKPGVTIEELCRKNVHHLACFSVKGESISGRCTHYTDMDEPYYIERIRRKKWYLASNRLTQEGGLVCVRTDITSSKKAEQELQKLGRALDQSPASVVITDTNGVIEYVNPKFEEVSGYSAEEAIGQKPSILKSGEKSKEEYAEMWHSLKAGREWRGIFHNKRKDGSLYWESARISPVRDEDGEIAYFIGVKEDITQQRQNEAQILYQANYDLLTGLPNRTLLMDRLRQNVLLAKRGRTKFAVLFIDLDRFKSVNDLYGHVVGDELMKLAAKRMKEQLRETDTVARFGGDEFVVLLMGADNEDVAAMVARKIIASLSRPFELDERKVSIGASVGITLYPADVDDLQENKEGIVGALLSNADMAMYQAKARGRNHYQFFVQDMQDRVKRHVALEQDLRTAARDGQLRVYYQPIVEAYSNEMIGMEALMRWQHPEHGMINPDQFIPLAEESGLIAELGEWIFLKACGQVREWQEKYHLPLNLSVNLSARQRDRGFSDVHLKQILQQTGLDPQYLTLEITENLLLKESDQATAWLYSLKTCGIKLSVDDFGTGYSSLSYLKRFPVDALKIDRSFVEDIPDDPEDVSLVTAIVAMADSLNIGVVAEGVETEEQCMFLKEIGCDYMQGFLFGKPLSAEDMEKRIANRDESL